MRPFWAVIGLAAAGIGSGLVAQSTTRPVPGAETEVTRRPSPVGGVGQAVIYRDKNFSGPAVSVARARPDLGLAWSIHSIRIERGTWEICSKANFDGRCARVDRSHAILPASMRSVQSIRPVYDAGWELIGEREVQDQTEHDTIISWGHARHRRLRICVEGHAVRFYEVELVYFFAGKQDVPVRALIGNDQCTRDIDLGGARDISFVNLKYETFSFGYEHSNVQVYAQR